MKKYTRDEVKSATAILLAFAVIALLKAFLYKRCEKANTPLYILLDMNLGTVFTFVMFWALLLLWSSINSIKTIFSDLREALHNSTVKIMMISGLVLLLIPQLLWNTNEFAEIKINGKKPLKIQYNWYLLCDTLSGETDSMTLDATKFKLNYHSYSSGSSRFGHSHVHTAVYASYGNNNVYLYNNALRNYITACNTYKKHIEVVYYKNSGIIQTIDGIPIYDEQAFLHSVDAIELEEKQKQEAEKAIEEETEANKLALFSAFFESEGKNYEEIVKQLEKEGIENTYNTIYISTHYYDIGEIALFDNPRETIYVVRDNKEEDMLIIPPLPRDGTLTEITKILDDSGIQWEYDCMGSYAEQETKHDHSNDILNTYSRSPGTPVPKDYVFWFSVRHIGKDHK